MRCGYCGQHLIGESGTGRNGERRYYYKCRGRKVNITPCEKTILPKDLLENLVIDFTVKELSKPQNLQSAIKGILALQESRTKVNTALNSLLKEKREIETAIDNTMKAIAQGVITKSTAQYLKQYEERQEKLERLILIEQSKTVIKITEKDIREFYEQALKLEPQMLINYLIKEVVLFNDYIEIHYNSPLKISPDDENRGFSFYSKTVRFMNKSIIITLFVT